MSLRSVGAVLLLCAAACASPTELPDRAPDEDGVVVSVSGTSVHVKAESVACGIVFRMDGDTRVLVRREDGTIAQAARADVTVGRRAEGWAAGAIAESCPAQATAAVILLD